MPQIMEDSIVLTSDSYKQSHHRMTPKGLQRVYSYFESRLGAEFDETTFFGLQYMLKRYLEGRVVTKEMIDEAEEVCAWHFGDPKIFQRSRWDYILDAHGGTLPLVIKAVPEGLPVPVSNVLMTVENTDDKCPWLTNHVESLLTHIWSPSTVCTQSREIKKIILKFLQMTASSIEGLDFMLHDFGLRGASSLETAMTGGAGHLVNFKGTDTMPAMRLLRAYYGADKPAFSVPASEHSVMTSRGREGEARVLEDILNEFPEGILSIVIDSYDYREFIKIAGTQFKEKILKRNGKVVFRPDSGCPTTVTKEVLHLLARYFGVEENDKGYYELNSKVGALWGDGIGLTDVKNILQTMADDKWSASNIVFGMGGGLLQKVNRDTQRFAFKCSHQVRDGMNFQIFKNPVDRSKMSKRGRFKLIWDGNVLKTVYHLDIRQDVMQVVFENGQVQKEYSLDEIRANAEIR